MPSDLTRPDIVNAGATSVTAASPQLAVVIPVYREGHYLADSVLSVVRQTMSPIAIVIVDDGCPSSSTPRMAHRLARMFPNVTYLRTKNRGVAHARNYRSLVIVAAGTGLRQGEAFGLTEDHVDLRSGHLEVVRSWWAVEDLNL